MPRPARQHSQSGYLHIVTRGIGKQVLFVDRSDRLFYLSALERFSRETGVAVCAYCLMDNHVHLLVREEDGAIALLMKKIGVSYSLHFNRKYERSGHLFQDRYRSEAIESDLSFLAVARYILQNPQKAGLGPAAVYEWSSYDAFGRSESFVDTALLEELLGGREAYAAFIAEPETALCLDVDWSRRSDEWAQEVIRQTLGVPSGVALQSFEAARRDACLRTLKQAGLTVRQLERLTGLNRGVIQRA